jgi:hypothetical protein
MEIPFLFICLDTSIHFCDVFVAHNKIAISNFHMKTFHIALYGILFQKLHRNLCGTIFSKHSSKLIPIEL